MLDQATKIIMEEAQISGIPAEKIIGKGRRKSVVIARKHAIRRCRVSTSLSLPELGEIFGGRDHTTILHYLKDIHN